MNRKLVIKLGTICTGIILQQVIEGAGYIKKLYSKLFFQNKHVFHLDPYNLTGIPRRKTKNRNRPKEIKLTLESLFLIFRRFVLPLYILYIVFIIIILFHFYPENNSIIYARI